MVYPRTNWMKTDTNGTSRGNLEPSSTTFPIINQLGNIVVSKVIKIQDTTNLVVEVRATRGGLFVV